MNDTARVYLDDATLFADPQPQKACTLPIINQDAVRWYESYFQKMMAHFTFQLRLKNGDVYYVFSTVCIDEWETRVQNRLSVQATKFLDKMNMEGVLTDRILAIRDVTNQVRTQYEEQRAIIFNSYALVEQIMQYTHTSFVEEMITYVLDSRQNDASKRRFWRIVNERYYGLDIHPLMEYEEDELQKILYYCQHPSEQRLLKWRPVVRFGTISAGAILAGWLTYLYLFS